MEAVAVGAVVVTEALTGSGVESSSNVGRFASVAFPMLRHWNALTALAVSSAESKLQMTAM